MDGIRCSTISLARSARSCARNGSAITSAASGRREIFKNYALKSMNEVRAKLSQAILYIERNPKLVRSITSFPYIVNSL